MLTRSSPKATGNSVAFLFAKNGGNDESYMFVVFEFVVSRSSCG